MKSPHSGKTTILGICSLAALFVICGAQRATADTIWGTNSNGSQLQTIDTTTDVVTNIFSTTGMPQGLTFDGSNQILYTTAFPGQLALYNITTHTNSILVTLNAQQNQQGAYVTLDPGGMTALYGVSGFGIDRINLTTHSVTQLFSGDARGMTYDNAGHLFAIVGPNELAQINPTNGSIMNSIALPSTGGAGATGLAFDPASGKLFVTDDLNDLSLRGLYEVGTNLASATLLPGSLDLFAFGLTADGKGNLYIAEANHLDKFNIAGDTLTTVANDSGLFDVAFQVNQTTTPEPGTMTLLGSGLVGLAGILRRKLNMASLKE